MKILIDSHISVENSWYNEFYKELKKRVNLTTFGPNKNADICVSKGTSLQDILKLFSPQSPDLIVTIYPEHNLFPYDIINAPCPTLAMISDWNWYYYGTITAAKSYDIVLSDKNLVAILNKIDIFNIYPWNMAYMPDYIHKIKTKKIYDITFIGSINKGTHFKRDKLLEKILFWFEDSHKVNIKEGVYGEDYVKALNQSRIVFNYSARSDIGSRVFETMGCGSLSLYESDNTCIKDFFKDREDLVLYNEDNLKDIITYYLDNEEERELIAQNGYEIVHKYHRAENCVNRFMELLEKIQWKEQYGKRLIHNPSKSYYHSFACHCLEKNYPLVDAVKNNLNENSLSWQFALGKFIQVIRTTDQPTATNLAKESFTHLQKYLTFNPNSNMGRYLSGIFYLLAGELLYSQQILENLISDLKNGSDSNDEEIMLFAPIKPYGNIMQVISLATDFYSSIENISDIKRKNLLWITLQQLAVCYEEKQQWYKAIELYMESIKVKEDSTIYYKIGDIYEKLNNIPYAVEYYIKCYKMGEPFNVKVRYKLLYLLNIVETDYNIDITTIQKEIQILESVVKD